MTTDTDLEIRRIAAGEEAALAELESPGSNVALELWAWRHPPGAEGAQVVVAESGGRLVAVASAVDHPLRVAGRRVAAARIRTVVGPEQTAGLGDRVTDELAAQLASSARVEMVLRGRSDRVDRSGGESGPWQPLPHPPRRLRRKVDRAGRSGRALLVRAELAPDWEPRLDDLAAVVAPWYRDAAIRSAEHALQRWAGHPRRRWHRFLLFPRFSSKPLGWLVLGVEGGVCRWEDLLWPHDHPAVLEAAGRLATRFARQVGAEVEEVWIGGDAETRERLQRMGFDDAPLGVSLEGLALRDDLPACGLFYATAADLDEP